MILYILYVLQDQGSEKYPIFNYVPFANWETKWDEIRTNGNLAKSCTQLNNWNINPMSIKNGKNAGHVTNWKS